jgi:hypothetical protein
MPQALANTHGVSDMFMLRGAVVVLGKQAVVRDFRARGVDWLPVCISEEGVGWPMANNKAKSFLTQRICGL